MRLDEAMWQSAPAGGVGPPGFLGGAAFEPVRWFYTPLHDYHLGPPDLDPALASRCDVVTGRSAILSQTDMASHTDTLTVMARQVVDADWIAVAVRAEAPATGDVMLMLHRPGPEDRRVAIFEFWWSTAEAREDQELLQAAAFVSAHALALDDYVGVLTATDDQAVIEQYSIDQPVVRGPGDMLIDLGLEEMIEL